MMHIILAETQINTDTVLSSAESAAEAVASGRAIEFIQQLFSQWILNLSDFFISVLLAILFFFLFRKAIQFVIHLLEMFMQKRKVEVTVAKFLSSLIRWLLIIMMIFVIIEILGFPTASILAALGSAGLTIGLALQGALSNFAGGVLILLMHPFRVGDYITECSTNQSGFVEKIDIFYTTLMTYDKKKIVIPNGKLTDTSIINVFSEPYLRIDVPVMISYSSDIDRARKSIMEMLEAYEHCDSYHPRQVVVNALSDNGVELICRFYARKEKYWDALYYVTEHIKHTLDQAGIEIPYTQLDVHMIDD